jgi:hypothetical protein
MAGRYDKYEPKVGGFRAPLDDDVDAADTPIAVGLDNTGHVVVGAGNTGIVGVLILTLNKTAGTPVDVMTGGECVEMADLTAGTVITANTTTGVISDDAASATQTPIGFTVEATRLIVRKGVPTFDDAGA